MPKDQAQAIVDRIGSDALAEDTTLPSRKLLPARPVAASSLRVRDSITIARVQVPAS